MMAVDRVAVPAVDAEVLRVARVVIDGVARQAARVVASGVVPEAVPDRVRVDRATEVVTAGRGGKVATASGAMSDRIGVDVAPMRPDRPPGVAWRAAGQVAWSARSMRTDRSVVSGPPSGRLVPGVPSPSDPIGFEARQPRRWPEAAHGARPGAVPVP